MINVKSAAIGTVAALVLSLPMGGCQTNDRSVSWSRGGAPRHVTEDQTDSWWSYQFVYHPQEQVYFEPYSQTFFWFANDQWEEGSDLPSYITLDSNLTQVVKLQYDKPYRQHHTVMTWSWPYKTPKMGSIDPYHSTAEAIALSEQRFFERSGMFAADTDNMMQSGEMAQASPFDSTDRFGAWGDEQTASVDPMDDLPTIDDMVEKFDPFIEDAPQEDDFANAFEPFVEAEEMDELDP